MSNRNIRRLIYLPESDNETIKLAYRKCKSLGINVLMPDKPENIDDALHKLSKGIVDAVICGITMPTAVVIRSALRLIGCEDGVLSSYFIMVKENERLLFADCAVIPNPTPEQLSKIAIQTADSATKLGINPRIAFLSYSTNGSAYTKDTDKILRAMKLLPNNSGLCVAGEWQFDTAYNPVVRERKHVKSPFGADKANVYIFPDLNSGNIGYKIAQQLGGYVAVGPIFQGLKKPVCDLSRGATVEDVIQIIKTIDLIQQKAR